MKIGIFDSGLGGLLITHSVAEALPQYDYLYLGDAARMPYGNHSPETIYSYTRAAVSYLFEQDCGLVVIACNTASAEALSRLERDYLPVHYPDRHLLGVLMPTAKAAAAATRSGNIGLIATMATVASGTFTREIAKCLPAASVRSVATPLLVPLIEHDGAEWIEPALGRYLEPLRDQVDTLVLGCTHYPIVKDLVRRLMGPSCMVISQDELMAASLRDYLAHHPDDERRLSRGGRRQFEMTDLTFGAQALAQRLYGTDVPLKLVTYNLDPFQPIDQTAVY